MGALLDDLVKVLDLESALVVLATAELIRYLLNVVFRKHYTDFWYPVVAVIMGQLMAWLPSIGYSLTVMVLGLKLAGSAIVFSTLWKKFNEGFSWFTKGKKDPVLNAKVDTTEIRIDEHIKKVKKLLKKQD